MASRVEYAVSITPIRTVLDSKIVLILAPRAQPLMFLFLGQLKGRVFLKSLSFSNLYLSNIFRHFQ